MVKTDKSKKTEFAVIAENLAIAGADDQNRTGDLLITNQLLYRLSYIGIHVESIYVKKWCAIFILRGFPCQAIIPMRHQTLI